MSIERFLSQHWAGETPVDLTKLCLAAGIRLRVGPLPTGEIARLKFGPVTDLVVWSGAAPIRQRFAAAHALAHVLLGHTAGLSSWVDTLEQLSSAFGVSSTAMHRRLVALQVLSA